MEANYKDQFKIIKRRVWCLTTTALAAGTGVVYDYKNGTAATEDRSRAKTVEAASATNNQFFAGVLLEAKPAGVAKFIDIACPGSDLLIYLTDTSATIGDVVQMDCGDETGQFKAGGMGYGCGSAKILTTVTAAGLVHAKLLEGDSEGILQELTPVLAGGAIVPSLTGTTIVDGTLVSTANLTSTLANGTVVGQRKAYKIKVTIGNSKNYVVTVTTGVQLDGSTALATITFNAANEQSILEWTGAHWKLIANSGATLA